MADVASKDPAAQQAAQRQRRWLPMAFAAVAALVLANLAYFGMKFFRDSTYEDERAFRVLGHIVGQFGNFQGAIAGALSLVPQDKERIKGYAGTLSLREISLRIDSVCPDPTDAPPRFRITQSVPRSFGMCLGATHGRCPPNSANCGDAPNGDLTISGPLDDQLPAYMFQDLFDSVIITSNDGATLASVPRGQERGYEAPLHEVVTANPLGGNAAGLLQLAARHTTQPGATQKDGGDDGGKDLPAGAAPSHATVFNEEIGGQPFRVFVLPFTPAYATVVGVGDEEAEQPQLYLIALKKQRVLGALNNALGSGGALVVTLCVLLGVLAWPLMSLRFESPREAIAPGQLFAILISLLLLPAVIATAGFSLWSRHRLMLWADQQAEHYARRVEQVLITELDSGVHTLEALARQLLQFTDKGFQLDETLQGNVVCVEGGNCDDEAQRRITWPNPPGTPENWSFIRSAAPLNREGKSSGLTLNFFSPAPVRRLDVHDRQYFQAIMQHEEWQPEELWSDTNSGAAQASTHRYVAQRLFNRTDAARVLQIAIPIDDANGDRVGAYTGDTRVYGLTHALRRPLLRFAVFDSHNGAVLFHSRDRLSLAENLMEETEHNTALEAAMQRRASSWSRQRILSEDHFSGRYQGAAHRFLYRSVAGAPWGIVVFYPTEGINEIVLQTAVATLACYFALVSVATLALALLILALPERADLVALRWLWPKWPSRDLYPRVAFVLTQAVLAIAVVLAGRLYRLDWGWILLAVASLLALRIAMFRTPFGRPPWQVASSLTDYKRSYVRCIFAVLVLVSALPAVLVAIDYHDTSVRAMIREELEDAAEDEQQRRHALLRDLQRFTREQDRPWKKKTAEAWIAELSRALPMPGYTFRAIDGDRPQQPTWLLTDGDPEPWLNECGPPLLGMIRLAIWSLPTARQVQRPFGQRPTQDVQANVWPGKDVTPRPRADRCRTPIAVRTWLRDEDTTQTVTTMALAASTAHAGASFPPLPDCSRRSPRDGPGTTAGSIPGNGQTVCRDSQLTFKYAAGSSLALLAVTLVCIVLVSLISALAARRLFGIRIPFAGRFMPGESDPEIDSHLLDAELELLKQKQAHPMTSKDEADWRAVNCRWIYERMWMALPTEEQLLLHQLAGRQFANPENRAVIERLLRRGYLTLAPWPRIVEPGFADFIRTVEPDELLGKLKYETAHTLWSQLRTPLLVVVVVVAGLLMWLAGSAMHILAGTLAGVAALFGSIAQVTNFIHRDKPPPAAG